MVLNCQQIFRVFYHVQITDLVAALIVVLAENQNLAAFRKDVCIACLVLLCEFFLLMSEWHDGDEFYLPALGNPLQHNFSAPHIHALCGPGEKSGNACIAKGLYFVPQGGNKRYTFWVALIISKRETVRPWARKGCCNVIQFFHHHLRTIT